jgi:hypothetical protein
MTETEVLPPLARTESGAIRRVGIELEFGGLSIDRISDLVAEYVGGKREIVSEYEHVVSGDRRGDWHVEFDLELLKQWGRQRRDQEGRERRDQEGGGNAPDDSLRVDELLEQLVKASAEPFVPMEVVSPPIPMDEVDRIDVLVERLREAGARGTRDGIAYAFGMHLNPEMPALDAATIARYLKAFLCLFDWLRQRAAVDLLRRLTPYIDPFPASYVRRVIDSDYWPSRTAIIDDYLAANSTRNRALDLLPLFAHIDAARVRAANDDPRIKARPALHYRLPNCEIDRLDWSVLPAWRDWLEVERLAADTDRLQELCAEYRDFLDRPWSHAFDSWASEVAAWLKGDR